MAALVRLVAWRETDPSVWRRITQSVRELRRLWGLDDERAVILANEVAGPPLARVGQMIDALSRQDRSAQAPGPDGSERWRDLRGILTNLLGVVGNDADARTRAHELFMMQPDDAKALPDADATLLAAALDIVAATATANDHAIIETRWRTSTNPQDTVRYLYALADTPLADRFDHTLELAIDDVRAQDSAYVLRRALGHPRFGSRAFEFISSNWDAVMAKVPSSAAVRMLEGIRSVTDADLAASITEFMAQHPTPSGERVLAQHLERMHINVDAAARVRSEPGAG